jgi:hypothetical protein
MFYQEIAADHRAAVEGYPTKENSINSLGILKINFIFFN